MANFTISTAGNAQTVFGSVLVASVNYPLHVVCDASANTVGLDNISATVGELQVSIYGKGSANGDTPIPSMDTVGHAGFQKITDGTHTMPTADAAARKLFAAITDGTNTGTVKAASTPAALTDTSLVTQAFVTDGTNQFLSASLANLQAYTGQNALLVAFPGQDLATADIVTGTSSPSASLAAPGASKIYVVNSITITLAATANQAPLLFKLVQDAAGTPKTLWEGALAALANTSAGIALTGLSIPQTVANKTLTLSVITGTIVSTNYITCTFSASIAS